MSFSDDAKIARRTTGWGLYAMVIVSAVVIGLTFLSLWLKPTFLGFERKAYVASHQYVEARKTAILTYVEQATELEVQIAASGENEALVQALSSQRDALAAKIRSEVAKMPREEVPPIAFRY